MSVMWEYFTVSEKDQRYAVCKTCSSDISRGGSIKHRPLPWVNVILFSDRPIAVENANIGRYRCSSDTQVHPYKFETTFWLDEGSVAAWKKMSTSWRSRRIQQNGWIHNALQLRPFQSQCDPSTDGCSVQGLWHLVHTTCIRRRMTEGVSDV